MVLEKNRGECQLFPECLEVYGEHCAKCSEGYVIGEGDMNDQGVPLRVCKAVSNTVNHCKEYQADGLCAVCESGYFLHEDVAVLKRVPENDKQCIAWPKEILKCKIHFKDNKNNVRCLECEPGYMLSEKMDRCEEHRDENCMIASNIGCESCFSGFALQETSLNLVPAHLRDYSIGKNILTALDDNRKRADLVSCRAQIPYCQRYITISSFDTTKLANVKKDPNEEYISNNEGEAENESEQSEDERVLLLNKSKTRKLFEIKFGDDEQNKWIIGISKGTRQKMDSGMGQGLSEGGNGKIVSREPEQEGLLMNDNGEIVTCGRCARGYFLYQVEPLRFECMEAQFIEHCEEYLDRNTCYLCDKHFFLKDGKCIPIEVENFVDHCQYYTPDQDCLVCENEFALLRMVGTSGNDPEVTDDFHEAHPYMANQSEDKKKNKNRVKLTQKTFGEVIEVEGKRYQKVEQMSITQLMTHETFREYIEGKKTMDDVAQTKIDSLGVHYDLSTLHLNFENENANTEVFQKETGTQEDHLRHNHELQEEIQRAKKQDADEDETRVDTQQDLVGEQVIEKQVITENSQQSDEDISEGTIVEKGDNIVQKDEDTEMIQDSPIPEEQNKTEEDFVVLTEDKDKSSARRLLDLLNIFSSKAHKPVQTHKTRWSLNSGRKKLKSLSKGRILEGDRTRPKRNLAQSSQSSSAVYSEDALSTGSSPKSVVSQVSGGSSPNTSGAFAEDVVQESEKSRLESQATSNLDTVSGEDGLVDEQSLTSTPSESRPNDLKIEKDNGVVLLNESESESVHTMSEDKPFGSATSDSQASQSEGSSSEPKDSQASQSGEADSNRSDSQSGSSSRENSQESKSQSSASLGTESENLQKVYDSKHIVMETPEDLKKREIQKDKEILDRLFDRESGEGFMDPDKLADKHEKLRLIHNIINGTSHPISGDGSRPVTDKTDKAPSPSAGGQNLANSGLLEGVNLDGTGINVVASESDEQAQKKTPNETSSQDASKTPMSQGQKPLSGAQGNAMKSNQAKSIGDNQLKFTKKTGDLEAQPVDQDSHIRPEVRAKMNKRSLCMITNPIPNCSSHFRGACVECEKDFHLINNICKPLSEENRKMFCQAYNHQQNCVRCKGGFVLVAGNCLKFKEVVNCRNQVYYPNGKCLVCKNGFYFDEEEKKCLSREQKYFKEKKKEEDQDDTQEIPATVDEDNGEDIGFDRNCLLIRNNSDKSCFMCKPGFYMDKKGNCLFSDGGYSKSKWSLF